MRDGNEQAGPRVPIPGNAGERIAEALRILAMKPGDARTTIRKERMPDGGYRYVIEHSTGAGHSGRGS